MKIKKLLLKLLLVSVLAVSVPIIGLCAEGEEEPPPPPREELKASPPKSTNKPSSTQGIILLYIKLFLGITAGAVCVLRPQYLRLSVQQNGDSEGK